APDTHVACGARSSSRTAVASGVKCSAGSLAWSATGLYSQLPTLTVDPVARLCGFGFASGTRQDRVHGGGVPAAIVSMTVFSRIVASVPLSRLTGTYSTWSSLIAIMSTPAGAPWPRAATSRVCASAAHGRGTSHLAP